MTQEALIRQLQISCLGLDPIDPLRLLVDDVIEALAQTQECFLVATVGNWGRIEWVDGVFPSIGNKMYSAPPQRTWVGLTEAERIEIDHLALSRVQAVQMTEAKLKELNT
jgi:hypothetical protein